MIELEFKYRCLACRRQYDEKIRVNEEDKIKDKDGKDLKFKDITILNINEVLKEIYACKLCHESKGVVDAYGREDSEDKEEKPINLDPKVEPLSKESCDPKWLANELADKAPDIKNLMAVAEFKDGTTRVISSHMNLDTQIILKEKLNHIIFCRLDEKVGRD